MSGPSPDPSSPLSSDAFEDAPARLREALAILDAIDAGELLSELPEDPEAARNHQCAVSLLVALRRNLDALRCDLSAALFVDSAMTRIGRAAMRGRTGSD